MFYLIMVNRVRWKCWHLMALKKEELLCENQIDVFFSIQQPREQMSPEPWTRTLVWKAWLLCSSQWFTIYKCHCRRLTSFLWQVNILSERSPVSGQIPAWYTVYHNKCYQYPNLKDIITTLCTVVFKWTVTKNRNCHYVAMMFFHSLIFFYDSLLKL